MIRFSSKKIDKILDFFNKGYVFDLFYYLRSKEVRLDKKLQYHLPSKKASNKESIPRILYKTGKHKEENLPDEIKLLFKKILLDNPEFKIKYFNDDDSLIFIKNHFNKEVADAYQKLKPGAYKADLFRYCVLYINGGIYGDLTQSYKVPIKKIVDLKADKLVLVRDRVMNPHKSNGIQISFLAGIKGLSIFKDCIDQIVSNVENKYYGETSLDPSGPYLFRKVFQNYTDSYRLELEGDKYGKTYIRDIRTGKIFILNKLPNHNALIGNTKINHYSYLWDNKDIYYD